MSAGRSNPQKMFMVVSLFILVAVEIFGVALASGWAIAGLFELGSIVSYVLMALFSGFAAYGMQVFMRRVMKVEWHGRGH